MASTPIVSEQFIRLLDKRLKTVYENEWKELPSMIDQIYNVQTDDNAWVEFFGVGAVPDIPAFNGKLQYLSVSPGYTTRVEHKEFAGGLQFERKLLDDKKYNVLNNQVGNLTEAGHRTREKYGVETFAYAFSTAFNFMTSEEGVSLCSDSHTTKSGVSTASGFDNAGTSALSPVSVAATRLLMRRFRGDIGQRIQVEPDMLIVPDNLYDTALEITQTTKGLYSAEGTVNVQEGRFKVVPYLRLDDYDSNNWFMVDSRKMKKYLVWFDRVKPESKTQVDWDTFAVKWSLYFRISCGFTDWRWIFGQNVS
jgi:hypothetical protein